MEIEKSILFKIEQQFPAIFRENGPELVQLIKDYYEFMETETNMSLYRSRRLFEYRDIANTTTEFIIQYHKTFMADLDLLDPAVTRLAIKNILGLYRRKGTPGSIKLFFRLFYQADAEISYPGKYITKPSSSSWRKGIYLEMYTNDNSFFDKDGNEFTYADLYGRNIRGAISEARAAVDTISFLYINNTLRPIIYLSDVLGTFQKYDDVVAIINGNSVSFGRVLGSLSEIEIDDNYGGTPNHKVGEIFNVESIGGNGRGGKAIVSGIKTNALGTIEYSVTDPGFGYTVANTELLVSDQVIIISNPNLSFVVEERLRDSNGNEGIVIGQNSVAVGVKMNPGDEFDSFNINAIDRIPSTTTLEMVTGADSVDLLTVKNDSSPGPLFPKTGNSDHVKVSINNVETVSLITDVINDFTAVPINSADYNTVPPALRPMSGTASPVTLATPLNQAFNLTPFDIGSIDQLINVNPGENYTNDAWAIARDQVMRNYDRFEQVIVMNVFPASFTIGEEVTGSSSGVVGRITALDSSNFFIKVRPYSYYGFTKDDDLIYQGATYDVNYISRDYAGEKIGESADIFANVLFESGQIDTADVYNSGVGYPDGDLVYLTDDDGTIHSKATIRALSQGITEGYWSTFNSHLSGWIPNVANSSILTYRDYEMRVQDSDYYQEYSYEIRSVLGEELYKESLENHVHLAGSKMFSKFLWQRDMESQIGAKNTIGVKEDDEVGGDPIVGPDQTVAVEGGGLRASARDYTVDSTLIRTNTFTEPA